MSVNALFWYYEPKNSNYLGWHFSCEESFSARLLHDLNNIFLKEKACLCYDLQSSSYGKVYSTGCKSKVVKAKELAISVGLGSDLPISIQNFNGNVSILCTDTGIKEIAKGIELYRAGSWDFNIGKKQNSIWFWPHGCG